MIKKKKLVVDVISWNFVAVKDQVQLLVSTNWSPRG